MTTTHPDVQQPRIFQWIAQIPTTGVLFLVAITLTIVTALVIIWRIFNGQSEGDIGQWLAFLAGLLGIERLGFVGKRATAWKPPSTESGVVTAEPINEAHPAAPARRVGPLTPLPAPAGDSPEDDPNADLPGRL
jgi:hypothetical protein